MSKTLRILAASLAALPLALAPLSASGGERSGSTGGAHEAPAAVAPVVAPVQLDGAAAKDLTLAAPAAAPDAAVSPAISAPQASAEAQAASGEAASGDAASGEAAAELAKTLETSQAGRVADTKKIGRSVRNLLGFLGRKSGSEELAADSQPNAGASGLTPGGAALAPAASHSVPAPVSDSNWRSDPRKASALKSVAGAALLTGAGWDTLALTMTPYLKDTFGDFSLAAELGILGALASIVGRQLSAVIVNRTTLKRGYVQLLGPAAAIVLAIATFSKLGFMTIPLLFGLMIAFRFFLAAGATSERSIPAFVLEQDNRKIEPFKGWRQQLIEVGSTWTEVIAGSLLVVGSFLPAFIGGPIVLNFFLSAAMFSIAIGLMLRVKIPADVEARRREAYLKSLENRKPVLIPLGGGRSFKIKNGAALAMIAFGGRVARGARIVMSEPRLRATFAMAAIIMMLNIATYGFLAPAYGFFAAGAAASSADAGLFIGFIAGMFSFGGMYSGRFVQRIQEKIDERTAKASSDAAQRDKLARELTRASMIKWLGAAALAIMVPFVAMALPLPAFVPLMSPAAAAALMGLPAVLSFLPITIPIAAGALAALRFPVIGFALAVIPATLMLPLNVSLVALAFFVTGAVVVVASMKVDSYTDSIAPAEAVADVAGFIGAGSQLASMMGLIALKFGFSGKLPFGLGMPIDGFTGLVGLAAFTALVLGMAPVARLMWGRARRLNELTAPAPRSRAAELLGRVPDGVFAAAATALGLMLALTGQLPFGLPSPLPSGFTGLVGPAAWAAAAAASLPFAAWLFNTARRLIRRPSPITEDRP